MGESHTKKLMSKDEVSKSLKIRVKDLKAFEEEGLFSYSDKARKKIDALNFERLKVAVALKRDLGVNEAGIGVILQMRERMDKMQKNFNSVLTKFRRSLGKRLEKNFKDLEKLGW